MSLLAPKGAAAQAAARHQAAISHETIAAMNNASLNTDIEKAAMALARRGLDAETLTTVMVQLALKAAAKANAWAAEEDAAMAVGT